MEEKIIRTVVKVYQPEELDKADRQLVEDAKQATYNSYAPYSKFYVGAAIEMADGEIITGANQENAAFSSGTCAERSACFYAATHKPGVGMKKIAIAARNGLGKDVTRKEGDFQNTPISPCGACRQALLEYETLYGDIEVILYGKEGIYKLPSIKSLMPLSFTEF